MEITRNAQTVKTLVLSILIQTISIMSLYYASYKPIVIGRGQACKGNFLAPGYPPIEAAPYQNHMQNCNRQS